MALAVGDKAPNFSLLDQHGKKVKLSRLQGPEADRVLLPEGRHARLHDAVVRAARRAPAVEATRCRDRRHQPRRAGEAAEVRREVLARLPAARRRRTTRSPRRGTRGARSRSTARSTWASSARRSSSTRRASSPACSQGLAEGHGEEGQERAQPCSVVLRCRHIATQRSTTGRAATRHGVEAAVDVDDLAGRHREQVREQRDARRARPARCPSRSSRAAPARPRRSSNWSKPGMLFAATVRIGPAATRLTRMPVGAEVAGEVPRGRLERGLRDAHPVVHRPGLGRVEVEADDRPAARS